MSPAIRSAVGTGFIIVAAGLVLLMFFITGPSSRQMLYHRCGQCDAVNAIEPNQILYRCRGCGCHTLLTDWRAVENTDYSVDAADVP